MMDDRDRVLCEVDCFGAEMRCVREPLGQFEHCQLFGNCRT